MLIHGDGNSNIRQGSCFELEDEIKKMEYRYGFNESTL